MNHFKCTFIIFFTILKLVFDARGSYLIHNIPYEPYVIDHLVWYIIYTIDSSFIPHRLLYDRWNCFTDRWNCLILRYVVESTKLRAKNKFNKVVINSHFATPSFFFQIKMNRIKCTCEVFSILYQNCIFASSVDERIIIKIPKFSLKK